MKLPFGWRARAGSTYSRAAFPMRFALGVDVRTYADGQLTIEIMFGRCRVALCRYKEAV